MDATQYFVAKTEKYTLMRKIGSWNIPLVSDTKESCINEICQKIQNGVYPSERELFEDIYARFAARSVLR